MPKLRERVEEWQTQITSLQTTIAELSQKLAAVEGRADLSEKVSQLEQALTAARTELETLKAAKPPEAPNPPPPPPEPPKPPQTPEPSPRKQSLANKLRRKSEGEGRPDREPKHREPRRKLDLI